MMGATLTGDGDYLIRVVVSRYRALERFILETADGAGSGIDRSVPASR